MLASVLLLAAAAMAALVLAAGRLAEQRAVKALAQRGAQSAALLDSTMVNEIARYRAVPKVLAIDPEVKALLARSEAAALLNRRLARIAEGLGAAAVYIVSSDGLTVAASNAETPASFVGQRYRFRSYFSDAMRNGSAAQFALGNTTLRPGLYLSERVDGPMGPLGVVVVKLELLNVEADWARSAIRAFVTDADNKVIVTSLPAWRFKPFDRLPMVGSADHMMARIAEEPGRQPWLMVNHASAIPGWTLRLLLPREPEIGTAIATAQATTLLLGALALALGMLGYRRVRHSREVAEQRIATQAMLEARVAERTEALLLAKGKLEAAMREQDLAEARTRELHLELEQANRLTTLGMIAAAVTHEIGQPVAAIRAMTHTASHHLQRGAPDAAQDSLAAIDRMTVRIGSITATLKSFARRNHGPRGKIRIADAIEGALVLVDARLREAGVRLVRPCAPPSLIVEAERVRVEQILANLLQNALDALADRDDPEIRLSVRAEGANVVIEVFDNGPGISADMADQLFIPFRTSKPQGSGLGLVISRDIATALGGSVELVAADPAAAGTTFRLILPASAGRVGHG